MVPPRSGWTTRTLPSEFVNSLIQCRRRSGQNCSLIPRMFIRIFGNSFAGCCRLGIFIFTASARTDSDPDAARCAGHRYGVHTHPLPIDVRFAASFFGFHNQRLQCFGGTTMLNIAHLQHVSQGTTCIRLHRRSSPILCKSERFL